MRRDLVPGRAPARRAARGFTLLEAIVAMVIFSLGAFALYGWLSTNLITLERVIAQREAEVAVRSALDLVHRVNPMEHPSGDRTVGSLQVRWNATLVEPARPSVSQVGMPTLFEVGLYTLDVRVSRDGEELHRFEVRQAGSRQVRARAME